MTDDMSDATKKVLKQQLGSVLTKEKPKPKYTPTNNVSSFDRYNDDYYGGSSYGSDFGSYGGGYGGSYYDNPDEEYAEELIKKMEMDPSAIVKVVDEESCSTLIDVITILLYR
jgi:hypothetical protein